MKERKKNPSIVANEEKLISFVSCVNRKDSGTKFSSRWRPGEKKIICWFERMCFESFQIVLMVTFGDERLLLGHEKMTKIIEIQSRIEKLREFQENIEEIKETFINHLLAVESQASSPLSLSVKMFFLSFYFSWKTFPSTRKYRSDVASFFRDFVSFTSFSRNISRVTKEEKKSWNFFSLTFFCFPRIWVSRQGNDKVSAFFFVCFVRHEWRSMKNCSSWRLNLFDFLFSSLLVLPHRH